MITRVSIYVKFVLVFLLTVSFTLAAGYVAMIKIQQTQLRNTAQSIAGQVVAFRSWVALSNVVYVDKLHQNFPDYLGEVKINKKKSFYSKNPALATRELSQIANSSDIGATFRVTSDKYRNVENKPNTFESIAIQKFKTGDDDYVEKLDGRFYRYSQPLYVTKSCLKCHGDPKDAPNDVLSKYGDRSAFGYTVGEVRGIITVNLPRLSMMEIVKPFINIYTIALLVIGLLLNFFLIKIIMVDRVKQLDAITAELVSGNLDVDIESHYRKNSRDEIDKLFNSTDLMKKSFNVMMKNFSDK